ncbi:MAG: hypothetical protein H7841_05650 [Magnetospirillum sp. WYHS-4]
MSKRGLFVALVVLGAVALAGFSLYYALSPALRTQPAETSPPPPELSPEAARRLFAERGRILADDEVRPALAPEGYAFLVGGAQAGVDAAPFFRELFASFSGQVGVAVLSASTALDDGRRLPPVPVAVLASSPEFRAAFLLGDGGVRMTPLFAANGAAKAIVSLAVSYVPGADAALVGGLAGEAESLYSFLSAEPAPLWTSPGGVQLRAQAFADRLNGLGAKTVDGLLSFDILLKDGADSRGRIVELVDTNGHALMRLSFRLGSHAPLFPVGAVPQLSLATLSALPADGGRTVGDYLAARAGQAMGAALTAGPAELAEACGALRTRLGNAAGLSLQDSAAVLRTVFQVRSLFATGGDLGSCLGPEGLAMIEKGGFPPTDKPTPVNASRTRRMDAVASQVTTALNPKVPPALRESLASRFAPGVALFDQAGFWLTQASSRAVPSASSTIVPAVAPAEAMEILSSLPVAQLGCAAPGADKASARRTVLVELDQDAGLWHLDLAFDDADRVAGIVLGEASQADFCRAMAARREGSICPFAKPGRAFRGIAPGKC